MTIWSGPAMFLVPLSLFLVATYLRPRTQAELSYLITAIECVSGLWCLLFAPLTIQLPLMGWFILRNAKQFSAFLDASTKPSSPFHDLSDADTPTIDVVAHPIQAGLLPSARPEQESDTTLDHSSASAHQTSAVDSPLVISTVQPALDVETSPTALTAILPHPPQEPLQNHLQATHLESQNSALVATTQVIQMQYRGVTYFKQVQSSPAPNQYAGQYRGSSTRLMA